MKMALRTCKECGKEYSNSAKSCPNCGAKNPNRIVVQIGGLIITGFVL
jgi:RNA polymerase subunit RPABC4/transcription elongation factor Spt4